MRLFAAVLGIVCLAGCDSPKSKITTSPAPEEVAAPTVKKEPTILEMVLAAQTLPEAYALMKPFMEDKEANRGAAGLAGWGMKHPVWKWFAPGKDETTFALAQKDIDEERGKRMCSTGMIVQISTSKTEFGRLYEGLMASRSRDIVSFLAVGSSGGLVQKSIARFCGVVTGKYSYENSSGGAGHPIHIVGMFDLPENKMAQEPAAEPQTRPAKAPGVAPPPVSRKTALCRDACDANYQSQSARSDCYNACDAL